MWVGSQSTSGMDEPNADWTNQARSHLLAEIQQTCDRVAILNHGHCIMQGTVAEVSASAGHSAAMLVTVADLSGALNVLDRAGIPAARVDGQLRVALDVEDAARISRALGENGHWVTDLRPEERSLEDLFLELTEREEVAP